MRVKMPGFAIRGIKRRLMESHRVRTGGLKEIVVPGGDLPQDVGKQNVLLRSHISEPGKMPFGDYDRLKGPNSPEGNQCCETVILGHHPLALPFQSEVVAEQASPPFVKPVSLRMAFLPDLVGNPVIRPDLAVRVRIACAHHLAAIFEDLNISHPGHRSELFILLAPGLDHLFDRRIVHTRNRQVMKRRKTQHSGDTRFGFGDQEFPLIVSTQWRIGQQRGKIVIEGECAGVLRVTVAPGSHISGTQIT